MVKNKMFTNPITSTRVVVAPKRAFRGDKKEFYHALHPEVLNFEPVPCDVTEFRGKPLVQGWCPFAPGREFNTTREYARYENGKMIVYDTPKYPEFVNSKWELRLIDNKVPLFDEVTLTGEVYRIDSRENIDGVEMQDALGKSYVLIETREHIVPTPLINHYHLLKLEKYIVERELKKPYIQYIVVGKNNAGLPVLKKCPICNKEFYEWHGELSGTTYPHPHSQILSMAFLPLKTESEMEYTERWTREHKISPYEKLIKGETFTLMRTENFTLLVDPAPKYVGTLTIFAHWAHNIAELNDEELFELALLINKAQQMIDVRFNAHPGNMYFKQSFKWQIDEFPNTKMRVKIFPRENVHALLEQSTGVIGMHMHPLDMKREYKDIMNKYVVTPPWAA